MSHSIACSVDEASHVPIRYVLDEARLGGLDLRRTVFTAFVVDTGPHRDDAHRLWRKALDEGWQGSLYVDDGSWRVKIGRVQRLREETLMSGSEYADGLARAHGGILRDVIVEVIDADDSWTALAAKASRAGSKQANVTIPKQRELGEVDPAPAAGRDRVVIPAQRHARATTAAKRPSAPRSA